MLVEFVPTFSRVKNVKVMKKWKMEWRQKKTCPAIMFGIWQHERRRWISPPHDRSLFLSLSLSISFSFTHTPLFSLYLWHSHTWT